MTARLLIPADVGYDEWLARRAELSRQAVTASEIAVILGISPWDSPFNLYWRKRGAIPDQFDSVETSLGRHLEPWIADQWAADHPEWCLLPAGLFASEERPWQLATPDRRLIETCGPDFGEPTSSLLEIKSSGTYDGWGEDGTDEIPAYYRAQVLWQMDVFDLPKMPVTCFFLGTRSRRDYTVAYDEADVALMRKAAQEFLARLETGEPPDIDHHTATLGALKALHPDLTDEQATVPDDVAEDYRWARHALKSAKEAADLAENRLRDAMGAAHRAVDKTGEKVCTRSIYTVPEHTRKAYTVDKLNPTRSKK
jgi:putative phage-type endonuclease